MDNSRHIVALEIGSSKIKGLVASVGELGDIQIIDIEETRVNDCVRYGKIQNVQEVSSFVNNIIRKLENHPRISPRKITDVFVSLGGRSLATVTTQAQATFPGAVEITEETINRLKRDASFGLVTDKVNLDMVPNAFYVDNKEVKKIVGTIGSNVRAVFSAIVISPVNRRNLDLIKFDGHSLERHYVVRPTALADLLLSATERQIGCVLVDFGAETTTLAIYKDDTLQKIITLPIGSRNITRDLMSGLSMTEESAEMAKARNRFVSADTQTSTDIEINNYISARAGEIVANILHQIEAAGFKPQQLAGGIILTGGGSRLHNFDKIIEAQSKMPVRIAAVDSSLQFKTGDFDSTLNLDLLAIAKYATEKSSVDCLTPAPEHSVVLDIDDRSADDDYLQASQTVRRTVDEDSLLDDDADDDEVIKSKHPLIKTRSRHRNEPEPVKPVDDLYDGEDDDDDDDPRDDHKSLISNFKTRLAKFWTNPPEDEEDDLDAPAN